jgi:hypothetical protein
MPAPENTTELTLAIDSLSPKQEEAIVQLLNQPTVAKAAAMAGVAERSLYRWLSEQRFATAYRRCSRSRRRSNAKQCQNRLR